MKKIILLILLLAVLTIISQQKSSPVDTALTCNFFTESTFNKNIIEAQTYEISGRPIAAVVPHNENIMDISASTLKTVSKYAYDTVIILAPNHKARLGGMLISGESWNTPVGTVTGNSEVKEKICKYFGKRIIEETNVVQEDHSASIVIPYIKEYMPKTKVVTILLDKEPSINEIYELGEVLNEISKEEKILVLGSIDFAHYQDYETTVARDKETIRLIKDFNIEQLKVLYGENLDTSESMGIILSYAKGKGINEVEIAEERIKSNLPVTNDYGSYLSIIICETN